MRFLVDESTGPIVARWLREQGNDAPTGASFYYDLKTNEALARSKHYNGYLKSTRIGWQIILWS
jgi:hypothetical protein